MTIRTPNPPATSLMEERWSLRQTARPGPRICMQSMLAFEPQIKSLRSPCLQQNPEAQSRPHTDEDPNPPADTPGSEPPVLS